MCTASPGKVQFSLTVFDESTGQRETLQNVEATILDTPYDFILGRPDIKRYNTLDRKMSQFRVKSNELEPLLTERDPTLKASRRRVDPRLVIQAGSSTFSTIFRKEELLTPEFDDDGMDWECSDDNPWFKSDTSVDPSQTPGDSYKPLSWQEAPSCRHG